MNATTLVLMTISMFVPDGAAMRQAWQIAEVRTLDHCLTMNRIFAQGGAAGVITVRCDPLEGE